MSHPWYINNRCKVSKRRESIWNHSFEGKQVLKLFYCMKSRQVVLFLCLSLFHLFSCIFGCFKTKSSRSMGNQILKWSLNAYENRDVEGWLRKIFLRALCDIGRQLWSSTGHEWATVQEQPQALQILPAMVSSPSSRQRRCLLPGWALPLWCHEARALFSYWHSVNTVINQLV